MDLQIVVRRVLAGITSVLVLALSSGCSIFGVESVAEAPYQVVRADGAFEVRDYEPLLVAETRVESSFKNAGSQAFRKLFAYISGDNEASKKIAMTAPVYADSNPQESRVGEKIAMTAPVTSQQDGSAWRYRFVLPEGYRLSNAPKPLNADVELVEIPAKRLAAFRYAGRATDDARMAASAKLLDWLESQDITPLSEPQFAGYNSPWALPPFRRNEVLVQVGSK